MSDIWGTRARCIGQFGVCWTLFATLLLSTTASSASAQEPISVLVLDLTADGVDNARHRTFLVCVLIEDAIATAVPAPHTLTFVEFPF